MAKEGIEPGTSQLKVANCDLFSDRSFSYRKFLHPITYNVKVYLIVNCSAEEVLQYVLYFNNVPILDPTTTASFIYNRFL